MLFEIVLSELLVPLSFFFFVRSSLCCSAVSQEWLGWHISSNKPKAEELHSIELHFFNFWDPCRGWRQHVEVTEMRAVAAHGQDAEQGLPLLGEPRQASKNQDDIATVHASYPARLLSGAVAPYIVAIWLLHTFQFWIPFKNQKLQKSRNLESKRDSRKIIEYDIPAKAEPPNYEKNKHIRWINLMTMK